MTILDPRVVSCPYGGDENLLLRTDHSEVEVLSTSENPV
jgi:hypothetical protein